MMIHTHNVNNELSTFFLEKILYNFKCALHGFYSVNYFKTFLAIQAGSQPYAYKFCLRSDDFKGLKILPFNIGIITAFFYLF